MRQSPFRATIALVSLALLMVLLSWSGLHADTHYVSKTGSNTWPYTSWAAAADSLRIAAQVSSPGDTILVGAGTFYDDFVVIRDSVALIGCGPESTIVSSVNSLNSSANLILPRINSTVKSMTLSGSEMQIGLYLAGGGGVMRNLRVTGFATGIFGVLLSAADSSFVVVIDSCIVTNTETGISIHDGRTLIRYNSFGIQRHGDAILCRDARAIVHNNTIVGIGKSLATASTDTTRSGIALLNCPELSVKNNLIIGGRTGIYVNSSGEEDSSWQMAYLDNNTVCLVTQEALRIGRGNVTARNNIAHAVGKGSNWRIIEVYDQPVQFSHNLLWDFERAPNWDTMNMNGTVFADPMFADTTDYLLQAFSPAIDAGDPTILDGDGSRSDIGHTGGPGGISYVYQDLPPKAPLVLVGSFSHIQNRLSWRPNPEVDLGHYEIRFDFQIGSAGIENTTISVPAPDTTVDPPDTMFSVSPAYIVIHMRAVDEQGNASGWSDSIIYQSASAVDESGILPEDVTLHLNYPNPFNAATQITYALPEPSTVRLVIYDVLGRHVNTLVSTTQAAGAYSTTWNGTNDHGHAVGSGVYFYRLTVGDEVAARKMLLLK